ncbi:hypothetical protein LZ30DRAFT_692545 [Colletotrichum cereale]|nr:hypothetical protein LZ30DRAFT_692545 [Colletotrichum cereale]
MLWAARFDGNRDGYVDSGPSTDDSVGRTSHRGLSLGDSIAYGFASSNGSGFRNAWKNLLVGAGNTVDMIGGVQSGTIDDNDNECHNGYTIPYIAEVKDAYEQRPNVDLLHAGTIIMNQLSDPDTAPQRLNDIAIDLVAAIIVPRTIPASGGSTDMHI